MIIERVQVDGGFLDNLDLQLTPGLNVIIGGRGTGKTSIIELIRFCLGVPANTGSSGKLALEHALSTLGDGRVSVTLIEDDSRVVISRSAVDDDLDFTELNHLPIIYSQTEIESVGLSSQARIRLLDSFDTAAEETMSSQPLITQIASLTVEMSSVLSEFEQLQNSLMAEASLLDELKALEVQEKSLGTISVDVAQKQQELNTLSKVSSELHLQSTLLNRSLKVLEPWRLQIDIVTRTEPDLEQWKESSILDDKVAPIQKAVTKVKDLMLEAKAIISETQNYINSETAKISQLRIEPENKIRELRKDIDSLQQGAGTLLNQVSTVRQKIADLDSIKKLRTNLSQKYKRLSEERSYLLNAYEEIFNERFLRRKRIAANLNSALAPLININLEQAAEYSDYINAIVSGLRGSSLRYNEIAPILASSVSPRELVEAIENNDSEFLMNATGFTKDRVLKLIAQLKITDLQSLLSVTIEDDVVLQLLDGKDYKEVQNLSVGQRCTVVLPIVLEHSNRTLIVDQPEDHLDNAFIVHTLIKAIKQKQLSTQLLFSTHNANIPVLGEAENVIVMKSNGQRGYVSNSGKLDHQEIVEAITTIMEGGRDAFEQRAEFYHEHP